MKLRFLGATETVTGSKYLLTTRDGKVLIDCGLFQGYKELRLRNWAHPPFDPKKIDAVLLTHAHIDHSGYLPLLVKQGFQGPIYATHSTIDLCSILLPDSGYLQEEDAKRANRYGYSKHHPALPLYTEQDALNVLKQFKLIDFEKKYNITHGMTANWYSASHILGASFIRCEVHGKSVLFTGDMGRPNDPILYPPHPIVASDYLVIESTYGDRTHSIEDPKIELAKIIQETAKRGGTILIPSFAVGRAQLILYYLYQLKKQKLIPDISIYLDSPLAIEATEILQAHAKEHKMTPKMCEDVCRIAEYIRTPEESKAIEHNMMPKIIIAASGMATGGRVLHHLKYYGPSHRNTILFTGYQAGGTRGGRIMAGERTVKIHGQEVEINAHVAFLSNTSAHADSKELIDWLSTIEKSPKRVFITHGELNAAAALSHKLTERFGWSCSIPKYQDVENL